MSGVHASIEDLACILADPDAFIEILLEDKIRYGQLSSADHDELDRKRR
jgi:hypothetical protein